jgi:hypothetical protein
MIFADDYRGRTVVFRGEFRTEDATGQAELYLQVHTDVPAAEAIQHYLGAPVAGSQDWAWQQVTAPVPEDAIFLGFGVTLTGSGRAALRNAELTLAPDL